MIDLHCHVLCGIDDGPTTIEGSVEFARVACAAGTRRLVATPHVSPRYPNDAATIARALVTLRERLAAEQIELEVLGGAEIAVARLPDIPREELTLLGLGGGPWLLIEPPFVAAMGGLERILLTIAGHGQRVLLAHPERCPTFQRDPQMLARLVEGGIATSITAGSLTGQFGEAVRAFALELVRAELVHNVTSDAHDPVRRPPSVLPALEQAGLTPLAAWLTKDVPSAILRGEDIPARPLVALPAR